MSRADPIFLTDFKKENWLIWRAFKNNSSMSEISKIWYLENFSMMKVLKPEEMKALDSMAKMTEVPKNQVLYFPKDQSNTIYLLKKGKVKISKTSEDGREIILGILGPGEIFGELALTGEDQREELARATDDAIVCRVELDRFKELMSKNSDLNFAITKFIGLKVKRIQTRLENLIFKSSKQRVLWFIKDFAREFGREIKGFPNQWHVDIKLTHQEIGKLTATSRQMVTTVLSDLERKGLIKYDRNRIYILDITKLD